MSVTSAQAESALQGGAATNIRWTHVAPTLLIIWIVSMFDKSNMAIVMNDQNFLNELGLASQQGKLGWLSSSFLLMESARRSGDGLSIGWAHVGPAH
jgi:hypothetical protein